MKMVLFNDVVNFFDEHGYKFKLSEASLGDKVVRSLVDTLWMLDPHRQKFKDRSVQLPLDQFSNYYDWKSQKKARPQVSV